MPLSFRSAASFRKDNPDVIEYDLDNEDEDWLATYNGGQSRLQAEKCDGPWLLSRANAPNLRARSVAD